MLELRTICENCEKPLPPESTDAMICSYECTFCRECVDVVLKNVCPNCTGGFTSRPIRPKGQLEKNPPVEKRIHKPVDVEKQRQIIELYIDVPPQNR